MRKAPKPWEMPNAPAIFFAGLIGGKHPNGWPAKIHRVHVDILKLLPGIDEIAFPCGETIRADEIKHYTFAAHPALLGDQFCDTCAGLIAEAKKFMEKGPVGE